MKKLAILAALLAIVVFIGCELGSGSGDGTAQSYVNGLVAMISRTGDLRGRVLFPSEYAQHSITFALNDVTFVTRPDGRFQVTNIPVGNYHLTVHMKGYEPVSEPVRILRGDEVVLNPVRLVEAHGRVLGRLVRGKGHSAKGVEVRLSPDNSVATTDGDGIFQFLGVSAGDHTLEVKDPRFFTGNQHFKLTNNERRNLGNIRVYRQVRGDPQTARLQN